MKRKITVTGGACAAALICGSTHGALIQQGFYQLHDHPDANQDPPPYGIRWDGLDGSNNVFTMSFDHPNSDMIMFYDGSNIVISGEAWGGRDVGGAYANDAYLGLYEVNFVFSIGVGLVPGDDDVYVNAATGSNSGTIKLPNGSTKDIYDKNGGPTVGTFRLGDENNDLGHRGFAGTSGWGWFEIDGEENMARTRDFLFTAEFIGIPAPATALVLAPGLALAGRRRR